MECVDAMKHCVPRRRALWMLVGILLTSPAAQAQVTPTRSAGRAQSEGSPLGPVRRLAFTTREGSWMSLDVSPDGQTLAFDHLGDLFTLPITGGTARRLTAGMAFDAQPRFSPDGQRIVFVSDRGGSANLWTISLVDQSLQQLTWGETDRFISPDWTPDGRAIIVTREEGLPGTPPGKLYRYSVDGGTGSAVIGEAPADLRMLGASFGADGHTVWFSQLRQIRHWVDNSPLGLSTWQLTRYDLDTGRRTEQTARYGGGLRPTLSPDGHWLVYGTRHVAETALRLRDLRTGEERWLAYPVQRDEQESRAMLDLLPGMSFTPDSRELVASYSGSLWRVPLDGRQPVQVPFEVDVDLSLGPRVAFKYPIADSPTFPVRQVRDAVPSPDGRKLAFTALGRLYVMEYPGGVPRLMLVGEGIEAFQPAWSPDGRSLVYGGWTADEEGHLYRISASGRGDPVRLTRVPGLYEQPAWSPDGKRIVCVRSPLRALDAPLETGATQLVWVPAAGPAAALGIVTVVSELRRGERNPHFTGDAARIYLYDKETGALFSIRFDGSDRQEHIARITGPRLPNEAQPMLASWAKVSPTGNRVLAQIGHDLYVINLPANVPFQSLGAVSLVDPTSGSLPVLKLSDVGGTFPAWSGDGRKVHWSIADAHVARDLEATDRRPGHQLIEHRIAIQATRDLPKGVVVLRGARVITMRGDEVIEDGDIVVRNHRIAAVGSQGSVPVTTGADVIDLRGRTIVPGFLDLHVDWTGYPGGVVQLRQPWDFAAYLAYGVTTLRDPYPRENTFTRSDLVAAGELIGPRIYSTGPPIFRSEAIRDSAHVKTILQRYRDYYRTGYLKVYDAGERRQRQWIVAAAREMGLMPTTEGWIDTPLDLSMVMDGFSGQEHMITGYPFYEDVVRLYAESGITLTPTVYTPFGGGPASQDYFYATEEVFRDAKLRRFLPPDVLEDKALRRVGGRDGGWFHPEVHVFPKIGHFLADVVKAGGRIAVGSHADLRGLGYHWELWSMQAGGLREHDALRAATLMGAQGLGLDRDLGSIEPGKLADLVVLDRNPLENIRYSNTVRLVMKNGRLYDGDTLNEIWPRRRPGVSFHWARDAEPNMTLH